MVCPNGFFGYGRAFYHISPSRALQIQYEISTDSLLRRHMRIGTLRRIVGALGGVLKMQVEIDGRDYPLGFSATHAALARA